MNNYLKTNYDLRIPLRALFALIVAATVFSGCKKDGSTQESASSATRLSFILKGNSQFSDKAIALGSGTKQLARAAGAPVPVWQKVQPFGKGLEAEVTVYDAGMSADAARTQKVDSNVIVTPSGKQMAVKRMDIPVLNGAITSLADGTPYIVYIFDDAGNPKGKISATAGTSAPELPVDYGKTYSYKAYVLNGATIDESDASNPTLKYTEQNDVLVASGQITTSNVGRNEAPVTFAHKQAGMTIIVDDRGDPYPSHSRNNIFVTYNSGEVSQKVRTGTTSTTGNNVTVAPAALNWSKVATNDSIIYSNNVLLPLTGNADLNLTIKKVRDVDVDLDDTRTYYSSSVALAGFNPEPGKRYLITLRTYLGGVAFGDNYWAPGNLYFRYSDYSNRILPFNDYDEDTYDQNTLPFYPALFRQQDSTSNQNEANIWATSDFNGSSFAHLVYKNPPTQYYNANMQWPYLPRNIFLLGQSAPTPAYPRPNMKSYYRGDPCSQVYPAGRWRLPTKAEGEELILALYQNAENIIVSSSHWGSDETLYSDDNREVLSFNGHGKIINRFSNGGNEYFDPNAAATGSPLFPAGKRIYDDLPDKYFTARNIMVYPATRRKPGQVAPGDQDVKQNFGSVRYWTSTPASDNPYVAGEKRYWGIFMDVEQADYPTQSSGNMPAIRVGEYAETGSIGVREELEYYGLNVRCVRADKKP